MIDENKLEINVDELMEKIREEAARRKNQSQAPIFSQTNIALSQINIEPDIEVSAMNLSINHIEALLVNAESRAIVRTKWPDNLNQFPFNLSKGIQKVALKILNFIFKDQREVNFNVINALKRSTLLNQQLIEQITILRSHLDEHVHSVSTRLQAMDERLNAVDARLQTLDERLHIVNSSIQDIDSYFNKIDTHTNSSITDVQERLDATDTRIKGLDERLIAMNTCIQSLNEHYIKNDSYLKNDLMQQKRLIATFLEEARQRLPESFNQQQLQTFINEDQHSLDAFYAAFEDQFRGSREDILNKLKFYLPFIEEAKVGTTEFPILDVGCGRGEWLELLRESGYTAWGLDINRIMLEQCRARGLEVIESDVIAYLQSLPDGSLGAVTGFHIIEHLPFEKLIQLFDETVRVLKPSGLVIYETPNSQNVQVGSHLFYIDPTHRNPLPSIMVKFVAEIRGLCNVKVINLNPFSKEFKLIGSEVAEQFSDYFYGPQDYAIIGYKL
ncbi:class I SAM-dependent methyltransferase [Fischerella sp. PCC 9605]|uniref:class I SAM-dependent methyltransferase n=1 Tax=Fischerella sp. PCC 9605 TaxID=1173024 RepID=UPI00047CC622|nr:class I SAM-dependent methyltransferase [Fischerella sp. PCC 9605]